MKASEIREMTFADIQNRLLTLKETLFNLRFQHAIGQLENPRKLRATRRDIARVQTILNEIRSA